MCGQSRWLGLLFYTGWVYERWTYSCRRRTFEDNREVSYDSKCYTKKIPLALHQETVLLTNLPTYLGTV